MAKSYTGIDIGERALKIAVVQDNAVVNCYVASLPEGLVADGRIVSLDAMADFIKQTLPAAGAVSKNVAFVVPANDCIVRSVSLPLMTAKELALNLPYEFRDYISQGKDNYAYDYAVLGRHADPDGQGEVLDLMAVASPKKALEDFDAMFRRAGLKMDAALPQQAALQNIVASSQFANTTCCYIDFGFRATRLFFFDQGKFDVLRTIEIGSASVDRAIANQFDVDDRIAADYLLRDYQGAQTCEAARRTYEDVAVEVSRALNFYGFNNPTANVEAIFFGGGASNVVPFVDAVGQAIDIPLYPASSVVNFFNQDPAYARCSAIAAGAALRVGC